VPACSGCRAGSRYITSIDLAAASRGAIEQVSGSATDTVVLPTGNPKVALAGSGAGFLLVDRGIQMPWRLPWLRQRL
jgi:hypothetical protein